MCHLFQVKWQCPLDSDVMMHQANVVQARHCKTRCDRHGPFHSGGHVRRGGPVHRPGVAVADRRAGHRLYLCLLPCTSRSAHRLLSRHCGRQGWTLGPGEASSRVPGNSDNKTMCTLCMSMCRYSAVNSDLVHVHHRLSDSAG